MRGGKDPADMVKGNEIDALNKMFSKPTPFVPFVIDYIIKSKDIENPLGKQEALKESNDFLKTLDPIFQEEYASLIARKLNINEQMVQVKHNNVQKVSNVTLSQIDIAELSIIRSALESEELYNIVKKNLDSSMFQTHFNEFNILKENKDDPSLVSLLLNEQLKVLDKDSLTNQILFISIPYYNKKLQQLSYDKDMDFKQRSKMVRDLKNKLLSLKSGKLISNSV